MKWLIWSNEHKAWWRAESKGYTRNRAEAGVYDQIEAFSIVRYANEFVPPDKEPHETLVPYDT